MRTSPSARSFLPSSRGSVGQTDYDYDFEFSAEKYETMHNIPIRENHVIEIPTDLHAFEEIPEQDEKEEDKSIRTLKGVPQMIKKKSQEGNPEVIETKVVNESEGNNKSLGVSNSDKEKYHQSEKCIPQKLEHEVDKSPFEVNKFNESEIKIDEIGPNLTGVDRVDDTFLKEQQDTRAHQLYSNNAIHEALKLENYKSTNQRRKNSSIRQSMTKKSRSSKKLSPLKQNLSQDFVENSMHDNYEVEASPARSKKSVFEQNSKMNKKYITSFLNKIANQGRKVPTSEVERFMKFIESGAINDEDSEVDNFMEALQKERPNTYFETIERQNKIDALNSQKCGRMARTSSMPNFFDRRDSKLVTPIDTVLFVNPYLPESQVDLHEYKEMLGKYRRIRVRKTKNLRSQKAISANKAKRKELVQYRKMKKDILEEIERKLDF